MKVIKDLELKLEYTLIDNLWHVFKNHVMFGVWRNLDFQNNLRRSLRYNLEAHLWVNLNQGQDERA